MRGDITQIDITNIKNINGAKLKLELSEELESLKTSFGSLKFKEPIVFKGILCHENTKFILEGNLKTVIELNCSSCNEIIDRKIDLDVNEIFAEYDDSEEGEIWIFKGNSIELDEMIVSNIVLDIPMKVLCSKDCKGLCPKCGHNLNISNCNCDFIELDPRFEKLNQIIFDHKEV